MIVTEENNFWYPDLSNKVKKVSLDPIKKAKLLGLKSDRFRSENMGEKSQEIINDAKQRDRSSITLESWSKGSFADTNWCKLLLEQCPDEIDRLEYSKTTQKEFVDKYESPNKPCIFMNATANFNVEKYWTFNEIYERYKDVAFKIGQDDKGKKIRVELKHFFEYLVHNKDDSPLYMFESAIEDIKHAKKMIQKYEIPKFFQEDIFASIGEKHRPPYRWFLIGPERSGTAVHIDPLYTSAWNTSLQGYKRWVLFHPDVPKSVVKAKEHVLPGQDDDAIQYFTHILPKLVRKEGRKNLGIIEFIQKPGETVFIPGGWWHAVVNVTDSIAVTQNYMNSTNIPLVWPSFRKDRPKLACYAMRKFEKKLPLIYKRLVALNNEDGFVMFDDRKNRRKKRYEEDEVLAKKENRQLFEISQLNPRYLSSDDTSSSSSSSSSNFSSSSESDASCKQDSHKSKQEKRKRSNSTTNSR